jgi:ABC-type uncharacterized transport system ATPase subunit
VAATRLGANNVTRRFGSVVANDDVTLSVAPGTVHAVVGENGAGKTTLMRILYGLDRPDEGTVVVDDQPTRLSGPADATRRGIGMVHQEFKLVGELTLLENLVLGREPTHRGRIDWRRARAEAERLAGQTGVEIDWDQTADRAPVAVRQRLEILRLLYREADVLILDEPTAGLDPKQIIETRELIKELAGDHTIILSTHILPEVAQTCQRIVIINKGRVVAVDTPDNLTARLRGSSTMYVEVDASGADAAASLARVPGVTRVVEADRRAGHVAFEIDSERGRDVRRDLARAVVASGWGLLEMRPMRMSLEDVFLSLTTEESATPPAAVEVEPEGETVNE